MIKRILYCLTTAVILCSCGSYKDIAYLQNVAEKEAMEIDNFYTNVIKPGDILSIVVSSTKPELALPYNLYSVKNQMATTTQATTRQELEGYTVDPAGNIDFPVLGTIRVEGLTRMEATQMLKDILKDYMPDPIVTVSFLNYTITVIGEVSKPGTYKIQGDRVSLFEAIGMAGDLTVYGKRNNVLIIRESGGVRQTERLDLKSKNIFESPYFYLQQNDVVYVEPTNARVKSVSPFMTSFPIVVSLGSLATSIVMAIFYINSMKK